MLTARSGPEQEAQALDAGADDFLAKPFSFVVLLGAAAGTASGEVRENGRRCWRSETSAWIRPLTGSAGGDASMDADAPPVLHARVPDAPSR